jgi:hypothetical protein
MKQVERRRSAHETILCPYNCRRVLGLRASVFGQSSLVCGLRSLVGLGLPALVTSSRPLRRQAGRFPETSDRGPRSRVPRPRPKTRDRRRKRLKTED